jgi:translation initiation factor IF-2
MGGAGEDDDARGARRGAAAGKAVSRTKGEPKRREGRLTIQAVAGDGDTAERMRSLASVRRAREREKEKRTKGVGGADQARVAREVVIPDAITVQDLAQRMATRSVDIIKYLMRQGTMLTINDVLDADTAELIASEFGHTVKRVSESDVETGFLAEEDVADDTQPRPPVVTVMGHVDHGKTSLLDALRAADVAGGEAGGITQHIGAYQVRLPNGERVTFLDTPGHAAFSAMRMRGANVTDIVVLVVAADDGVMPQTIEAINHARAAGAPIIVAVNKMDKPDANPTRVINELLQHEVVVESLGGETQLIEVSALKKTGLDHLIEAILLQAEVMDLRANPDRAAEGVIIEAKLDRGRGPVATVLVERGTLKRGDIVVAGQAWGKVRALVNERNEQIPAAGPSEPVEILGLDQAPPPGEPFATVENEARARELTEYRIRQRREKQIGAPTASASLAEMMAKLQNKQVKELALVIKADVQGSAEAIAGSLEKLGNEEVRARIIHSGVGAITESDVQLAKAHRRLQRARVQTGPRSGRTGRRGDPLLCDHLRPDRRPEGRAVGDAVADPARNLARQRHGAGGVQHHQGRQCRRLPRHRGRGASRRQGPCHPQRCGDHGNGHAEQPEALQGRRGRGHLRPRVRHELLEPGHQTGRRDRVLHRGDGGADAVGGRGRYPLRSSRRRVIGPTKEQIPRLYPVFPGLVPGTHGAPFEQPHGCQPSRPVSFGVQWRELR